MSELNQGALYQKEGATTALPGDFDLLGNHASASQDAILTKIGMWLVFSIKKKHH